MNKAHVLSGVIKNYFFNHAAIFSCIIRNKSVFYGLSSALVKMMAVKQFIPALRSLGILCHNSLSAVCYLGPDNFYHALLLFTTKPS